MKARLIIEPSDDGWLDQPERPNNPFWHHKNAAARR
jgi:hypothetical protein